MPHTLCDWRYSFQPDPDKYPRTTHSIGTTSVLRTTMLRPTSGAVSISEGKPASATSVLSR